MDEDFEFLTLHCLTLKQLASPGHVEAIVGVPAAEAKDLASGEAIRLSWQPMAMHAMEEDR